MFKDCDGNINLNLLILGLLLDLEFLVGGIIVWVFVNLIVKVVILFFVLIGLMFWVDEYIGELCYIEFLLGFLEVIDEVCKKLDVLGYVLYECLGIKFDIIGCVDF